MPESKIAISIIVCTRNRAKSLAMTLDSIKRAILNAPQIVAEAVLVDNGSTDDTQTVIKQWAASVPFPVKTPIENRPGLSCARNAGMRAATGEILAFTDDDCQLNPDYLTALARHYAKDTQPLLRGGKVELGDPTDLPLTIKLDEHIHRMTDLNYPAGFILGANMTMPRGLMKRIGFFDERFGAGTAFKAGEETDYIYRCYKTGIPVEYVPDVIVQHFHGRKDMADIARLDRGYQISNGALYAKYICDWQLVKHFYWDLKRLLRSLRHGGNLLDETLNITLSGILTANIRGMLLYLAYATLPWKRRSNQKPA